MKEEIKEILDYLKDNDNYIEDIGGEHKRIGLYEAKILLDYITNLQTIEQQYSAILSENAELENKITNLQEENERLKKENQDFVVEQNALAYYLVKKGLSFEDIVKIINDFKNEQGKSDE